ncbi:MAG: hypothetical protein AAB278_09850 [Pseudomonadota bacterium]
MKYLMTLLLLIFLQGCMLIGKHGEHGRMKHNKAADRTAHQH